MVGLGVRESQDPSRSQYVRIRTNEDDVQHGMFGKPQCAPRVVFDALTA